jgi:hypothetical protein
VRFKIGSYVRVTTMARTDAIGRVVRSVSTHVTYHTVRIPGWQADGWPLELRAREDELEQSNPRKLRDAVHKRGWTGREGW